MRATAKSFGPQPKRTYTSQTYLDVRRHDSDEELKSLNSGRRVEQGGGGRRQGEGARGKNSKAKERWQRAYFKLRVSRTIRKLGEEIVTYGTTELIKEENANFYQFLYHNIQKVHTYQTIQENEIKKELRIQHLIDPESGFRRIWDIVMFLLLIYTSTFMPFVLCFFEPVFWDQWTIMDLITDVLFACDIVITFFSSYTTPAGTLETCRRNIVMGYLKGWFVVDLVACFPSIIIDYMWSDKGEVQSDQYNQLFRIFRLPRLYRLLHLARIAKVMKISSSVYIENLKDTLHLNSRTSHSGLYKLLKFLVMVTICAHLMGCLWYFSARIDTGNLDSWVVRYRVQDDEKLSLYLRSIYWAITTLLTVGYGDISAKTDLEMILSIIWMVIGVGFYSYTVGSLSSFLLSIDTRESALASKLAAAQEFANEVGLDKGLRKKVRNAIKYHSWQKGRIWSDKYSLFADLPINIQYEVSTHMYDGIITEMPFFSKRSKNFCVYFMPLLKPMRLNDSEIIYKRFDYADVVYFIVKGRVNLVINYRQVAYKAYTRRSYIGEIEVIQHIKRIDTIVTLGSCEFLTITKEDFWKGMEEFPEYAREIILIAAERFKKHTEAMKTVLTFIRPRLRKESTLDPDVELTSRAPYEENRSIDDVVTRLGHIESDIIEMKTAISSLQTTLEGMKTHYCGKEGWVVMALAQRGMEVGQKNRSKSPLLHNTLPISPIPPLKDPSFPSKLASIDSDVTLRDPFLAFPAPRLRQAQEREKYLQSTLSQKQTSEELHRQSEATKAATELAQQIKSDEEKAALKQRWDKKTSKLRGNLPPPQYYSALPIKPGFFFIQSLIAAPRGQLKTLKVNIPETLYFGSQLWLVRTDNSGGVECDDSVTCIDFLKRMEKGKIADPKHAFDYIGAVLRRRGSIETEILKHIYDWTQFRNKMLLRDIIEGCMLQQFIRSVGGKASVIRLRYHPHTSDNKANQAYFLSNVQSESPEHFYRCVVSLEAVDSFEIFKLHGSAIKEVERYAANIVEFLSRGYNIRIQEIHLDFLKDELGVLWLCGCRGFILDSISISRSLSPIQKPNPIQKEIIAQEADDRRNGRFVRCKLCRLQYQNQELPHLISVRMLFVYKIHITKRVDLPLNIDHLRLVTPDLLSQSVRICELCFMLITSEFQLIDAEKRLAEAMNIKAKEEELEEDPVHTMQLQFLPKKMVQWRVLLYFRSIDKSPILQNRVNIRLSIDIYDCRTEFDIGVDPGSKDIDINRLKLLYFFASPDKSIRKFLNETNMRLEMWGGGEKLASGESLLLYHFPSSLPLGMALTQTRIISLFPSNCSTSFDLTLTVGLSCDRNYHSKYLKVGLTKTNGVYIPEAHYFNGTPLPVDWMEQFGVRHVDSSFKAEITPEEFYESTISKEELRRMRSGTERHDGSISRSLSRSKSRSRTPGLPPLSYQASSTHRLSTRLQDVPSLDLSSFAANNDQTVKDLIYTVNGYLRDRPKSALSTTAPDGSHSVSKTARTVTIEEVPKANRRRLTKRLKGQKSNSSLSTRIVSPTPSLKSFREHYRQIAKCVGKDLKAYEDRGGRRERTRATGWTASGGESQENSF